MDEKKTGARTRARAAEAVDAVVNQGRSLDTALAQAEAGINPSERGLARALCYGTLRFHWRLRSQVSALLDRPLKAKDSVIESLIAVGIYQLTGTRIPDHAAVSMTVDASRVLRRPKYASLINAVLRNFLRKNMQAAEPVDEEARYSHPAWLLERLRCDWPDHWLEIVEAGNRQAPMWLRVNINRQSQAGYINELKEFQESGQSADDAASHQVIAGFDQAVKLARPRPVSELPGFSDGQVSVQDAAAQLAGPWLLRGGAKRILDACAAPGGKTGQLLELAGPDADLTAIDLDEDRLDKVRENLARLGLSATVLAADASTPDEWWAGAQFDRILLDAPCSGSGVIRRHPDIKLLRRAEDIATLAGSQLALLRALWPLLEANGRLLYATCSVLTEENDAVVREFLKTQADARENDVLPNNNIRDLMQRKTCGYQILPGNQDVDGFYYACLERVG
ncbi:MAG: 16S rRNA (cytosine(967)-C(5))-methyltransferase RsmB [Proteobacteria bacterium]|jgi:16S rRNA (cytosine967-C5)-methyltransferase|nr:16S rRNA (cytosine(967)-C(5))-methyltransferase RsmB [Pseudomonadota bacterium]